MQPGYVQPIQQTEVIQENVPIVHPLVIQLSQMPVFQIMMAKNPDVAKRLLSEIQSDPSPAKVQLVLKNLIESQ